MIEVSKFREIMNEKCLEKNKINMSRMTKQQIEKKLKKLMKKKFDLERLRRVYSAVNWFF